MLAALAATTARAALPEAPQRLSATPGNRCVNLVWDAPAGAITNYVVYVDLTENARPAAPSAVVGDLNNGTLYSFTVAAVNGEGIGPASTPVTAVPAVLPLAPTGLTATALASPAWQVQLTWAPVAQQTGQIIGYTIYRSLTTPAQNWYAYITGTAGTYVDAGLNTFGAFTRYFYRVAAVDQYLSVGPFSPEAYVSISVTGEPAAPLSFTALALDGGVQLSWTADGPRDGYLLNWAMTPDGTQTSVPLADVLTTFVALPNDGLPRYFSLAGILGGIYSPRRTLERRTLPPLVSGVAAFSGSGYVRLTWEPAPISAGVTAYRVYETSGAPPGTLLTTVGSEAAYADVPTGGTLYEVRAINTAGESAPGGSVAAPAPVAVPAPPSGVMAAPTGNSLAPLSLTWSANPAGDAITAYRVHALDGPFSMSQVASTATALEIGGPLENGRIYRFFLTAVNAAGDSPSSLTVTTSPARPAAQLTGLGRGSTVLLSWVPGDTVGAGALYRLSRTRASGTVVSVATTTTQTAFADAGLGNGTHTYLLETLNFLGQSLTQEAPISLGVTLSEPPAPPVRLVLRPGNAQVAVNWRSSTSASGYILYRTQVPGLYSGPYLPGLAALATTYLDVSGLVNTLPYYYSLTAVNDAGESTRSAESMVIPYLPASLPADPAFRASQLRRQVRLSWNPSLTGSYPIIGYNLYRSTDAGGTYTLLGIAPTVAAASATLTAFTYLDTDITYGQTYLYRLHALDEDAVHALRHEGPAYPLLQVRVDLPLNRIEVFRNAFDPVRGEQVPIHLVQVQSGRVWIKVYTPSGEWVRTLFDQDLPGGFTQDYPFVTTLAWDGKNERGETVASGVYLIHAEGQGKYHQTRKVAVIK